MGKAGGSAYRTGNVEIRSDYSDSNEMRLTKIYGMNDLQTWFLREHAVHYSLICFSHLLAAYSWPLNQEKSS